MGRPRIVDLRMVADAMMYVLHTGCQWRSNPPSHPPVSNVRCHICKWSPNPKRQAMACTLGTGCAVRSDLHVLHMGMKHPHQGRNSPIGFTLSILPIPRQERGENAEQAVPACRRPCPSEQALVSRTCKASRNCGTISAFRWHHAEAPTSSYVVLRSILQFPARCSYSKRPSFNRQNMSVERSGESSGIRSNGTFPSSSRADGSAPASSRTCTTAGASLRPAAM